MTNIRDNDLDDIFRRIDDYKKKKLEAGTDPLPGVIATKLKLYRVQNNLTQEELARRLDVNRMQILRWEKGEHTPGRLGLKVLRDNRIIDNR